MLLYPHNLSEKLEFDILKLRLVEYCNSTMGADLANEMTPQMSINPIQESLQLLQDFMYIKQHQIPFPTEHYEYIEPIIKRLQIDNIQLDIEEFISIKNVTNTIFQIAQLLHKNKEIHSLPSIEKQICAIEIKTEIIAQIDKIIDEKNEVRSSASKELQLIRKVLLDKKNELERAFKRALTETKQKGNILSEIEESFRNGRRVLAIASEQKRQIRGIIHDVSTTGSTTFIEPESTIEISNDILDIELQEKREIARILKQLTLAIQPFSAHLSAYQAVLGLFDFAMAKCKLALEMDAIIPEIQQEPTFHYVQARHPILVLQKKHAVIPFDLQLLHDNKNLLISGPNAGGKSVTLKTVGLIQMMLQSGLAIPVSEGTRVGIFKKIIVDIGDQQSLEDELSTYSSRLTNYKFAMKNADDSALILFDEFGSGTDPVIGGAIAQAVLHHLVKTKCYSVITTHYANLKTYAHKQKGIVNASMIFDKQKLQPTYRLQIGKPGSSYAFEITEKIGLPKHIIHHAKTLTETKIKDVDKLLADVEQQAETIVNKEKKLDRKEKQLDELIKKYQNFSQEFDIQNKKIKLEKRQLKQTQQGELRDELNKLLGNIKEQLKQEKKLTEQENIIRKELEKVIAEEKKTKTEVVEIKELLNYTIVQRQAQIGDSVMLHEGTETGVVEAIGKKEAIVVFGLLKTKVKLTELIVVEKPTSNKLKTRVQFDTISKFTSFKPEIDLRGMTKQQTLELLETFMDEALMLNMQHLRIIHGKGDGILKNVVREKLREYKQYIESIQFEHADAGGEGVTVVALN